MESKLLSKINRYKKLKVAVASALITLWATPGFAGLSFTEVGESYNVAEDTYKGKTFHILGVCWIDVDNDGYDDLFATNGFDFEPHFYKNVLGQRFVKMDRLLPSMPAAEMAGCVVADYDNDGDSDIYIQVHNETFALEAENPKDGPANILLKNQFIEDGGVILRTEPLFDDVAMTAGVTGITEVPLGDTYPAKSSMTGGWLDYDLDGCVDLYVGQMVLQAGGDPSNADTLYKNNCDGTFTDVSEEAGIAVSDPFKLRPSLAFVGADLNNDLYPDMYVVNVHEDAPHHEDFIYINNGDGTFTDATPESAGVGDDAGSGMGVDVGDPDLDGDFDIYISDLTEADNDAQPHGNVFYLNNGDGTFSDNVAPDFGIEGEFSWSVNYADLNQDGYEDLLVGSVARLLVYINNGDGTYTESGNASGLLSNNIRGLSISDMDRDGDLDIVLVQEGTGEAEKGILFYRNDSTEIGNWLQLDLTGTASNLDAINAQVKVSAGGKSMSRQIKGGSSTHSQDSLRVHFGLDDSTMADEVRILWPSGQETVLTDVTANQILAVTEPVPAELSVESVFPRTLKVDAQTLVRVVGTAFEEGLSFQIMQGNAPLEGATISALQVVSDTRFTARVTLAAETPTGLVHIVVTSPDGTEAVLSPAFTVRP
jgi:hypothetical protein